MKKAGKNGDLAGLEPGRRGGEVQAPDGGSSEGKAWVSDRVSDWNSGDERMRAGDMTQLAECLTSLRNSWLSPVLLAHTCNPST